ncbi:F0F1 ATP synthase subunit delta [Viscerimonas tarda]
MNTGIISMRYARALFEYALEKKVEETFFVEMKNVVAAYSGNPKIRSALDNPVLNSKDKLRLIQAAAGGKASDTFDSFARLLLRRRRENHLQTIALVYLDLYRKHKNINVGKLITATPVNDATIQKMKSLLQKQQKGSLEFETSIDPTIGGGFILFFDTYRLDASVATQLRQIKQQLTSNG